MPESVQDKPKVLPVTVDLRLSRLALMAGSFAAIVVLVMAPFHGRGVTVRSFLSSDYTEDQQKDMRDNYNSYSSNIVSAFVTPSDWILGTMLPVIYLAFASRRHVQTNAAFVSVVFFMGSTMLIKYLINNGFNAVNVQIVPEEVQPFIASSDLKANTDALDIMSDYTTNVSNPQTENDFNYVTNTVLRNVIAPIVLRKPTMCTAIEANDTSQYATGLVQSFGFPTASWQGTMLPSNELVEATSSMIYLQDDTEADIVSNNTLTTDISTASDMLIHTIHASRYFFRSLDSSISPFNMSGLIQGKLEAGEIGDTGTLSAAELLGLVPAESNGDDSDTAFFIDGAKELLRKSLSGVVNLSRDDAKLNFRHVTLWDNISFDALTLEIPLRSNFYYRKLILSDDGTQLVEDTAATANYTSLENIDNTDDVYYDLDLTVDCGPNPGVCVMPRVLEYDFEGNEYDPEAQIKATAMCLNEDGTEEFQIDYTYDSESSAESSVPVEAYWSCKELSKTAFWVISFGSYMTGDDMYETPAPDAQVTPLDSRRATIVNPRKMYSLTVGRIGFDLIDFADEFNADCDTESDDCRGPRYLLDLPADKDSGNSSAFNKYIIVGHDSIPMDSLSAYSYNDTEKGNAYNGLGQGTRWLSLMALSRPSEDSAYTIKGDILLSYNFVNSSLDATMTRSGDSCSKTAEDYLNQIVNNHYYIEDGLQPMYTAAMYFIFQNGVVRDMVNITRNGESWTLDFDGNKQFMDFTVSIPTKSLIITFCGVAIILLGSLFVAIFSRCGRRSLLKNPDEMTADMVADMMLNDSKYPPMLLVRRFEHDDVEQGHDTFQQFRIDGLWLHHAAMGMSLSLPLNAHTEPGSSEIGTTGDSTQPEVPYYVSAQTPLSNGEYSHDPELKKM